MMRTLIGALSIAAAAANTFPAATAAAAGTCEKDTGGSCTGTFLNAGECGEWRGGAYCSDDKQCLCKEGYCIRKEGSVRICTITKAEEARQTKVEKDMKCSQDTGGSCSFFGCSTFRGPTDCTLKPGEWFYGCQCKAGYCAYDGKCVSALDVKIPPVMLATTDLQGKQAATLPAPMQLAATGADSVVPDQWKYQKDMTTPGLAIAAIILVPLFGIPCMVKCKNGNLAKLC